MEDRMRRFATIVVGLTLMGCSSAQMYWHNDNSGANWNNDLYQCTRENSTQITSGGGTGLGGAASAAQVGSFRTDYAMRDLCLKSRGWYLVTTPSAPTPAPPPSAPPPSAPPAYLRCPPYQTLQPKPNGEWGCVSP